MQAWDKGFEEWADIETEDTVENNSKILVTEIIQCITLDQLNDSISPTRSTSVASSIAAVASSISSLDDDGDLLTSLE